MKLHDAHRCLFSLAERALLRLYEGPMKALLRLYEGSMKTL
jgi:hypothetical protein